MLPPAPLQQQAATPPYRHQHHLAPPAPVQGGQQVPGLATLTKVEMQNWLTGPPHYGRLTKKNLKQYLRQMRIHTGNDFTKPILIGEMIAYMESHGLEVIPPP
jgi:hypothetical protein